MNENVVVRQLSYKLGTLTHRSMYTSALPGFPATVEVNPGEVDTQCWFALHHRIRIRVQHRIYGGEYGYTDSKIITDH